MNFLKSLSTELFDSRLMSFKDCDLSGVWRFRDAIIEVSENDIKTYKEGRTNLYRSEPVSRFAGHDNMQLKHEGQTLQDPLRTGG